MNRTDQAQVPNSARAGQTTTPVRQLLQALNWRPAQIESPATRWTVNVLAWAGAILVLLSGLDVDRPPRGGRPDLTRAPVQGLE